MTLRAIASFSIMYQYECGIFADDDDVLYAENTRTRKYYY